MQEGVEAIFAATEAHLGPVDVLVNNAALTSDQRHFLDADEAWWDLFLRVNLKSVFLCSHRAARGMAARRRGVILNVSSGGATRSHRGFTSYDAAKGGVEAFTRALALDMAPYGVRVNGITPGFINTYGLSGEDLAQREKTVPLGRYGTAEDMTGAAAFLTSDDAAYVTGQFVVVDGGVLVQQRSANVDTFPSAASRTCLPRAEDPPPSGACVPARQVVRSVLIAGLTRLFRPSAHSKDFPALRL